jgi:hypothetical protein
MEFAQNNSHYVTLNTLQADEGPGVGETPSQGASAAELILRVTEGTLQNYPVLGQDLRRKGYGY